MPIAHLGVLDLSIVTDALKSLLDGCVAASPLWTPENPKFDITVTGNPPDAVRSGNDVELSLYLFHVNQDRFQRNCPPPGMRIPEIPFQPLSLELSYLLSCYAGDDYVKEQQAMSIAMRCLHEHPIVRSTVVIEGVAIPEEFTLTMDVLSPDEMARIWQSTTVAMRLSAVYKVSVVFVSPEAPSGPLAKHPTRVVVGADATRLPFAETGQLTGTRRSVAYRKPSGDEASYDLSPATAAPGQRFLVVGGGLDQPTSHRLYLLAPGGAETEVTAWKAANPAPPGSVLQTGSRITVDLPAATGAAPAGTPPPGVYQLRAGSDTAAGDAVTVRSNTTPLSIAARIDVGVTPPLLVQAGGVYQVDGTGFVPGSTEVILDTVPLAEASAAPAAGEFQADAGGAFLTFVPRAFLGTGRYSVRVRVNQVESDPSWWIVLP